HVDDADDVRMLELLEDVRLRDEALARRLKIRRAVLAHFLDGPGFVCALVERQIHNAHAAAAHFAEDLVFSVDDGTDLKQNALSFPVQDARTRTAVMLSVSPRRLFSSVSARSAVSIAGSSGADETA